MTDYIDKQVLYKISKNNSLHWMNILKQSNSSKLKKVIWYDHIKKKIIKRMIEFELHVKHNCIALNMTDWRKAENKTIKM